jgi:hypothetical protein
MTTAIAARPAVRVIAVCIVVVLSSLSLSWVALRRNVVLPCHLASVEVRLAAMISRRAARII